MSHWAARPRPQLKPRSVRRRTRLNSLQATLREWFTRISPHPCWGVANHYGSWVRLNFGEATLDVREPTAQRRTRVVVPEGEFQLFVELADWVLEHPGRRATSESPAGEIAQSLAVLEGQKLVRAAVASDPASSEFEFDLGAKLTVRAYSDAAPDEDLWHLFHPPGELALRAAGQLVLCNYESDDESEEEFAEVVFAA